MTDKQQQKRKQKARQAQAKAQKNRDKARRKLLQQREKLARRRTRNRRQSETRRDDDDETEGTNPTAHSTLPPQKSNAENATRNSHSTVPETPKYSVVPARERLYGRRLYRKMIEGDETSTTTPVAEHETDDEEVSTDE
ncbi:protein gvpI [Halopenitus sp. H-Gu1]|uniref:protein gvpI n=1 Tax=Halopenitus sp. H-Gu1 TaxID=3242697 RepID=UPI00359EB535